MRKYIVGFSALLALVVVISVNASAFYDGNDMMEICKGTDIDESDTDMSKYNECVAYLAALDDAQESFVYWKQMPKLIACIPDDVRQAQLRHVFLEYMSERSQYWHLPAASFAIDAFYEAWPCKE